MKTCIICGSELEDNAKFCSECGAKQPEPKKICPNCGTELQPNAKFCMECGTPVSQSTSINKDVSTEKKDKSSFKNTPDVEVSESDENTISLLIKGVPFNMKLVKGREYGTSDEILDFYLGETPVTQALWMTVMESNPSRDNSNLKYPVTNVDESLINAFLIKLHKLTGFKFELPLREQWKYAYKGGDKSKGFKFAGSNERSEIGWIDDNLHQVGELYPNELGLYDMEGLVDELAKYKRIIRSSLKLGEIPKPEFTGFRLIANINPEEKLGVETAYFQHLIYKKGKEISKLRSEAEEYYRNNPKEKKEIEKIQQSRNEKNGFREGLRPFEVKGLYGYIKPNGTLVIEPKYVHAYPFVGGVAVVECKGKYGIIDHLGNWVIEPKFDSILANFDDELLGVEHKGKWGYIDKKGNWVIQAKYDDAWPFKNGVAKVELDGSIHYINKKGKILKNHIEKEEEEEYPDGLKSECDNDIENKGYIGKNGKWVIEPHFWGADEFNNHGFAFVSREKGGKWFQLDKLDILEF